MFVPHNGNRKKKKKKKVCVYFFSSDYLQYSGRVQCVDHSSSRVHPSFGRVEILGTDTGELR